MKLPKKQLKTIFSTKTVEEEQDIFDGDFETVLEDDEPLDCLWIVCLLVPDVVDDLFAVVLVLEPLEQPVVEQHDTVQEKEQERRQTDDLILRLMVKSDALGMEKMVQTRVSIQRLLQTEHGDMQLINMHDEGLDMEGGAADNLGMLKETAKDLDCQCCLQWKDHLKQKALKTESNGH